MFKRYLFIFIVFLSLVLSYFFFFHNSEESKRYKIYTDYVNELIDADQYENIDNYFELYIERFDSEEIDEKYDYVITFENPTNNYDDIKILIIDESYDEKVLYPSFGIFDYKGYSLVKSDFTDIANKKIPGINLVLIEQNEIESFLILFSFGEETVYIRYNINDN